MDWHFNLETNEVGTCIVLNPTITYTTCVLSSLIKYGTKKSEEVNASHTYLTNS
ncbi:hypothetical protein AAZX31_19G101700 [Glycine max]